MVKTNMPNLQNVDPLVITSSARLRALESMLNENKNLESTQNPFGGLVVFGGVTVGSYFLFGKTSASLFISPAIGLCVTGLYYHLQEKISKYTGSEEKSIFDVSPEFERKMLERYKHYYY